MKIGDQRPHTIKRHGTNVFVEAILEKNLPILFPIILSNFLIWYSDVRHVFPKRKKIS
jgi:hypothetical protein